MFYSLLRTVRITRPDSHLSGIVPSVSDFSVTPPLLFRKPVTTPHSEPCWLSLLLNRYRKVKVSVYGVVDSLDEDPSKGHLYEYMVSISYVETNLSCTDLWWIYR